MVQMNVSIYALWWACRLCAFTAVSEGRVLQQEAMNEHCLDIDLMGRSDQREGRLGGYVRVAQCLLTGAVLLEPRRARRQRQRRSRVAVRWPDRKRRSSPQQGQVI